MPPEYYVVHGGYYNTFMYNLYMKKKTQVLIIHGGMTFKNKKDYIKWLETRTVSIDKRINWAGDYLEKKLGNDFMVIRARMPMQDDAKYEEWKIVFERYIPLLDDKVILIGNSLGSIFLAKYLSENKFPKEIISTYLVCAPYDNSHSDEDLVGGFKLKSDLSLIEKNSKKLTLLFSADDECVPPYHAEKYKEKLANANIIIYKSKNGHFNIPEFPEIIKMIKADIKK
jgi:predicted alpha/beta hydrolase family esterase